MLIARGKKKENIVEYILYMWSIEDQIRALNLNIDLINSRIVEQWQQPDNVKKEISEWYESLIDMMRQEGVTEKGHLQINKNVIIELTDLHNSLLGSPKESRYSISYYNALPFIVELRAKEGGQEINEIETCLNLMYGILMLKLQKKEISKQTLEASEHISIFLRSLAVKYKEDREKGLDI